MWGIIIGIVIFFLAGGLFWYLDNRDYWKMYDVWVKESEKKKKS